jgi:hypothetical protein
MSSKFSSVKSIALTALLVAGVSGMARADDSSMSRFGGESYAYFNNAVVDKAPSAWRQSHPNGVSEQQLEAESSEGLANDFAHPTFAKTPSTWRQANPNGLSERELQALSSEGPAWHESTSSPISAQASTNKSAVVAKTAVK